MEPHGIASNVRSDKRRIVPEPDLAGLPNISPLLAVSPGNATIVRSSAAMAWHGALVEKHRCAPGYRKFALMDRHVISMFHRCPAHIEHRGLSGEFTACVARPSTIMITPPGPMPELRLSTPAELLHCALNQDLTDKVSDELGRGAFHPIFRIGLRNTSIQSILFMLMNELDECQASSRLYVDSLAYALATKYVLLHATSHSRRPRTPRLPPRALNRVREKIEANLDTDLSLEALSEETGYSRGHFLRMFHAATGMTPHQYVLDLRLRRAQECLRQSRSSILDVAVLCGFSSQSHMTTVFRRRFEMTPGQFRRNIRASRELITA